MVFSGKLFLKEGGAATLGDWIIPVIVAIVCAVAFGIIGFILGGIHRKKTAEGLLGSANEEATRIINQAVSEAETKKREAILEAKDEIHKSRTETERELRDRRNEVQRQERRIIQKEETLDKKVDSIEKKEELLNKKIKPCLIVRTDSSAMNIVYQIRKHQKKSVRNA